MSDAALVRQLRTERRFASYPLPPGSTVLVRPGQAVARGATLARVPLPPLLAPVAADLELPPAAALAALAVGGGARVRRGEMLARHRAGFRRVTLVAPVGGAVTILPEVGAVALRPDERGEIVARYGGRVRDAATGVVTVQSVVERLDCALASPGAAGAGIAAVFTRTPGRDGGATLSGTTAAVALVPHLAHLDALRPLARAGVSLVVAGTVSDELAWELLAPHNRTGEPTPRTPHVVAVAGPGDAAHGAEIIAALRGWHEREVWLEAAHGSVALFTEGRTGAMQGSDAPVVAELRDPTYWGKRAAVVTSPTGDSLTIVVEVPEAGRMPVPLRALVLPPDETPR